MSGGEIPNLVLKRILELFLKVPPLKKILEVQNQKKMTMNFVRKKNLEPKIKPMIENLQNVLDQEENKQTKGAKLRGSIRQELEGKKGSKTLFRVLEFFSKIPNIKKTSNEH